MFDKKINSFQDLLSTVVDYKEFAIDNDSTKFIYATNIKIPQEWSEKFLEEGIVLFSDIKDNLSLTNKILLISESTEH